MKPRNLAVDPCENLKSLTFLVHYRQNYGIQVKEAVDRQCVVTGICVIVM